MSEPFEALHAELQTALISKTSAALRLRTEVVFRKLLDSRDERASQAVVAILHGHHGLAAAKVAWKSAQAGLPLQHEDYVSMDTTRYSIAALSVMRGTVRTFEAVVLAGAPQVVPTELQPSDVTEWMDLVASTNADRLAVKLELMTNPRMIPLGVVGEIATFADVCPVSAQEAFAVVWRLAPHHPGFSALEQESSEPGAAVRAFLMSMQMERASQVMAVAETIAPTPGAARRRRRASI